MERCSSPANSFASTSESTSKRVTQGANAVPKEALRSLHEGISETIAENEARSSEILALLSKLNCEPDSLPDDIKEGLRKVSQILRNEELSEVDERALLHARQRRTIREKRKRYQERQLKEKYSVAIKRHAAVEEKLNRVRSGVDALKGIIRDAEVEGESEHSDQILLSRKLNDYNQAVDKLEAELEGMDINDAHPEDILRKSRTYLELTRNLAELTQSLARYADLPVNILQAKAALDEKESEYERISRMLAQRS